MSNCNTDSQSARNFCQFLSRSNKIYSPSNEYLERKECEIVKLLLKRVYWWYVVPEHREHILSFYRWNHTNHTHLIVYICARVLLLLCYMWHRLYWEHGNIYSIISPMRCKSRFFDVIMISMTRKMFFKIDKQFHFQMLRVLQCQNNKKARIFFPIATSYTSKRLLLTASAHASDCWTWLLVASTTWVHRVQVESPPPLVRVRVKVSKLGGVGGGRVLNLVLVSYIYYMPWVYQFKSIRTSTY